MFRKTVIHFFVISFFLMASMASVAMAADKYDIDRVHSTIGFAVKHLTVSTVWGSFKDYIGSIEFDPNDLASFKASVTIQTKSINTDSEQRDNHLRSADFLDAEKFPTISFKSKRLDKNGDYYGLVGDLTIRDVTKEVTIPVSINGPVKGMQGDSVIGLMGQVTINRQDYGVSWNKVLDNGGWVVDNNVMLAVTLEAHKK